MVKKAVSPIMDNVMNAVLKQRDIELVRDGAPTYLLFVEGLLEGDPNNIQMLAAAAQLYSSYASAFVVDKDAERAQIMTERARELAFAAYSLENETFAKAHGFPYSEFEAAGVVQSVEEGHEKLLFLVISTWAGYIGAHRDNMDNMADIPKIEALTKRLLELDETYYYGSGHLAMGVLYTLIPPSLGGKPDQAKAHFEKAIKISDGKFLAAQVMFAQSYARLVFDREIHDRLLKQVMDTPADIIPELTLANTVAKKQAAELLEQADEYF